MISIDRLERDLRDPNCKRSRPTYRFDPSHLPRLLRLVLLILLSTLVDVADESLIVALVFETGLVQDARLCEKGRSAMRSAKVENDRRRNVRAYHQR